MNCNSAQEILNRIFDGDDHPLAAQARRHLQECDACRAWHSSMVRTLEALGSCEEIDVPDIAAMVSRRLPEAHPASVNARGSARQWLLGALAACWMIGGGVLVFGALVAVQWLNSGSVARAYSEGRAAVNTLEGLSAACRSTFDVVGSMLRGFGEPLGSIVLAVLLFVIVDVAALAIVLFVWRRRPRVSSACFI